jgi:cytoskeletal protein CcmA (bactofilin family)
VVLGPRAKVFGNIEARSLTVSEGAYLDGNVRMSQLVDLTPDAIDR